MCGKILQIYLYTGETKSMFTVGIPKNRKHTKMIKLAQSCAFISRYRKEKLTFCQYLVVLCKKQSRRYQPINVELLYNLTVFVYLIISEIRMVIMGLVSLYIYF